MEISSIEDALQSVGSFGLFQKVLLVIGGVMVIPHAIPNYIMYFAAQEPSWKCAVNSTMCFYNGTLPSQHSGRCLLPRNEWEYTVPKDYTIATQYDLVCDSKWWIPLITSIFFFGYAIGSIVFGWLADKIGRKKVAFTCSGLALLLGLSIIFSPNIYVVSLLRLITGFLKGGVTTNFMVLACEYLDNKHRPLSTLAIWGFNVLGSVVLALTAYFIRDWKSMFIATTAPYLILQLFYFIMPESIRWLVLNKKENDAKLILHRISKINKHTPFTTEDNITLYPSASLQQNEIIDTKENLKFCNIISTLALFKISSIQGIGWLIVGILYFGLSLGAGDLGGSIYLNFTIISAVEIPAQLIGSFLSHRYGRKWTVILPLCISGATCFLLIFTIGKSVIASVALATLGKFFVSITSSGQCNWASELYPTSMRSEGLGFTFFNLTVGGMAAPWVFKSMRSIYPQSPYILMGTACILVSGCQMFLPETKGKTLTEDVSTKTQDNEERVNFKSVV